MLESENGKCSASIEGEPEKCQRECRAVENEGSTVDTNQDAEKATD